MTAAVASRPAVRSARRVDRPVAVLFVAVVALVILGLVMVLSASSVSAYTQYGSSFLFFKRQAVFALIGAAGLIVASRLPPAMWRKLAAPLLLGSVFLLVLVLHPAVGVVAGGSSRWIELGPARIQPSEIAKLAVVVFAAAVLAGRWKRIDRLRTLVYPLVPIAGLVALLILFQPDLGTALVLGVTLVIVLFVAGARLKHLVLGGLGLGTGGFALIAAEGYRWARFTSFLDPWSDPEGGGYQAIQSLIALTSGGPFGVGLGASRQKWSYVPNAHTDFIFSIIGEELGLLGNLLVLGLFGAIVYAGIRIALRAPDVFGRLLAAGVTAWIGVQAIVNLGAVTGLIPITGVPLPLVSYGGSSLVVSMIGVGILVSVARGRRTAGRR